MEDDASVADALGGLLRNYGFDVLAAGTGAAAIREQEGADLVLLDLGLPDLDGIEVCRRIRKLTSVPIIAVSARSEEIDKVLALRMGADDYVVKPFGFQELLARIEAVLRRASSAQVHRASFESDRLCIDPGTHRVWVRRVEVTLARKEFKILALLAQSPGQVVGRAQLFAHVWGDEWDGANRSLDVHISSLRNKLGDAAVIEVVRGVGYRLLLTE